jgi:predicted nucleic-acid-binding Zn-ribbon protein
MSKLPPVLGYVVGNKTQSVGRSRQTRQELNARRKYHEVTCHKCGYKAKLPLKVLSASHERLRLQNTDHAGNHFCCKNCREEGRDELREAQLNTASKAKLEQAIQALKKAKKFKAAELLQQKLGAKK